MTGGKIHGPGGAGELLGVNPNTLRNRMRKLGIPFRRDLRADGCERTVRCDARIASAVTQAPVVEVGTW